MTQIPIYRAKKIDSDEWVEGYLIGSYIIKDINEAISININIDLPRYRIDPSTISIHLPNMLDKNNNKIFASLSKDGRGGTITNKGVVIYTKFGIYVGNNHILYEIKSLENMGIKL